MPAKNIPAPAFADDDGSADPALAAALAAWRDDPAGSGAETAVLQALTGARLLVPVVAVLTEAETDAETGLRQEKSSDMAVPTLTAPNGTRALPAFTSTAALARWRADARPVAVPLRQALQALAQERADLLLLDVSGPISFEVTGPTLRALAGGHPGAPLASDAVTEALRTLLAAEPLVRAAHLAPGTDTSDGVLALALDAESDAPVVARRLAGALAADETLRSSLVHGLDLALLPPASPLPAEPLYRR